MSGYHSLLLRQLKRLGMESAAVAVSPTQWAQLLERVSRAYTEADQERYLLERSQDISSREMREVYGRLEEAQRIAGLGNWSFDRTERARVWSDECFRVFGLPLSAPVPNYQDFLAQVHDGERELVKQAVKAAWLEGAEFEVEFRLLLPDGATRWVRSLGEPVRNAAGTIVRVHGTVMDITRRKLVEQRQAMEHTVTRLLAEASAPLAAMPAIIATFGRTLNWACGALWELDPQRGGVRCTASWAPAQGPLAEFFARRNGEAELAASHSWLARVRREAAPVWLADLSAWPLQAATAAAAQAGLRAGLAFPIQAGAEVLGIVELFSRQLQPADADTLQSAHFIGRQIGQFLQRQQAEAALRESEAHFRALVEQASDAFYVHDVDGRLIDVNRRGCYTLGYTREELQLMHVADIDIDLSVRGWGELQAQIAGAKPIAREARYRRKDGSVFPVEIRLGPIEINGQRHLLSLVRDVTERKELHDYIQHLAYHDALTELPNRALFNRYLSHAIVQAQRHNRALAVLIVDLDRFKNINDTLGHEAGDRLLQEMGRRLTACLREGDLVAHLGGDDDLVARLGGDEFVVLIEEVSDPAYVSYIARKMLAALVPEYLLDGQALHITASIGISLFPEDGSNELTLMKNADTAMYRAKERGKNTYQFYSAQMNVHAFEMLALESGLRRALDRNELVLHYQPKVQVRTGRITGFEALLRWRHPELNIVPPAHFIPLAEETGLIVPIAEWVLREACTQACAWQRQGLPPLRVAVNVSARQFVDEDLLPSIDRVLQETGLDPALLELELTESTVMHNPDKARLLLGAIKAMGVSVAIDDFGIGYSSLSHLKQFPFDTIKIDRSFIKDIPGDAADAAITHAIIAMGKSLNIMVVAEGVETAEQWRFLRERGCDEIQGYYCSEPIGAEQFALLARSNTPHLTAADDRVANQAAY